MVLETNQIKCDACGRFIKSEDLAYDFQPDSAFTAEKCDQYHKKCLT